MEADDIERMQVHVVLLLLLLLLAPNDFCSLLSLPLVDFIDFNDSSFCTLRKPISTSRFASSFISIEAKPDCFNRQGFYFIFLFYFIFCLWHTIFYQNCGSFSLSLGILLEKNQFNVVAGATLSNRHHHHHLKCTLEANSGIEMVGLRTIDKRDNGRKPIQQSLPGECLV